MLFASTHPLDKCYPPDNSIGFGSTYPAMDSDSSRLVGANNSHTMVRLHTSQ